LETSLERSLSIWMICSSISLILPLACAFWAMELARSPSRRRAAVALQRVRREFWVIRFLL